MEPTARTLHKGRVTIHLRQPGIKPPVFIASSMTSPPWEPCVMHHVSISESGSFQFYRHFENVPCGDHQYKFRLGHGTHWIVDPDTETTVDSAGNENNSISVDPARLSSDEINEAQLETTRDANGSPDFEVKILNARLRFNIEEDVPSDLSTDLAMGLTALGGGNITTSQQPEIVEEPEPLEDSTEEGSADEVGLVANDFEKRTVPHETCLFEFSTYERLRKMSLYALWLIVSAAGGALLAGAWVAFGNPGGGEPL